MTRPTKEVRVIATGGTIDKVYDRKSGENLFQGKTHVGAMLREYGADALVVVQQLMLKDSLDMTEEDRNLIIEACERSKQEQIVITHGTDTAVTTAKRLVTAGLGKCIAITGAMQPYSMGHSDGTYNLASAVQAVQYLPTGVYVAMHGRNFQPDDCIKDKIVDPPVFRTLGEYAAIYGAQAINMAS